MIRFELLSKDKETGRHSFLVTDATPALANAIRRSCVELVPTMAIDTVEFIKNSGALYDEIVAHRLGLVSLKTDLKSYDRKETCKCGGEGCQNCTLKLTLQAKGPGYVYASDMKSQDPKVTPVYDKTIITKLAKNQELECVATAKLGTGREHAKFSPGLVWYTYKAKAKVNANHPQVEEFKDKYPPAAFVDGKLSAKAIEEQNLFDACDGINKEIVDIQYDDSAFIVYVEPWGQLSPKEILTQAIKELATQLNVLQQLT